MLSHTHHHGMDGYGSIILSLIFLMILSNAYLSRFKADDHISLDKENEIRGRIEEFRHIGTLGSNEDIFFELVYCMLAAGTSAELAFKVHNILRKDDFIISFKDFSPGSTI